MNLVLEEPDTNNDIRLIGVTLSKKHKREIILQTLDEFSRLLVLLKGEFILNIPDFLNTYLYDILNMYCKFRN